MKIFVIISLFLISINAIGATKEVVGQFVKVQWGDYLHLVLKVDKKEVSFWCWGKNEGIECSDIEKSPKKYTDKKLKVQYKVEKEFIPQEGAKVAIEKVSSIKLYK